jgi:hypothetical protein
MLYAPNSGSATRPPIEETLTIRPRPRPQQRQKALDHRHLTDHVDLQLTTQLLEREELERRGHGDAGVVHEPGERAVA